jgi:hypothetical protein
MITRESALRNPINPSWSLRTIPRRAILGGMGAALGAALTSPQRVMAHDAERPNDPFILLLHGIYQPVVTAPNLGLSSVHLSDGTYSRTHIYPVYGITGDEGNGDASHAIGTFYVQFSGNLCAYDLPGGAIAMRFAMAPPGAPAGFNGFVPFPDGQGGFFLEGTFELDVIEANGAYQAFQGGHNHMVDRLHQLKTGQFNEFCFCNISTYPFP